MPRREAAWFDAYLHALAKRGKALEPGWQADLLRPYVLLRGLGYPADLVQSWPDRSDIRVKTPEGLPYIVLECKRDDRDLSDEARRQALSYLEGGEAFAVLASPLRMRVFTPTGEELGQISLARTLFAPQGPYSTDIRYLWDKLSYRTLQERPHLAEFREGKAPSRYIPVHDPSQFNKFVVALRWCHEALKSWASKAWQDLKRQYDEYRTQVEKLDRALVELGSLAPSPQERQESQRHIEEERIRLRERYRTAIDAVERSFPSFQRIQPYSSPAEKRLEDLYVTDVVYAAVNRILLIRIAEDRGLVPRKVSNGGIKAWREFVGFIKERYQTLLQVAYADLGSLAPDFFERGIFDWYLDADYALHEVLERVFYRLNAFDLAHIDRDLLGDLYQEYLPPRERKALGEFYTPKEVVDYILKHIGWPAPGTLLDPACGSGGFLVRAIHFLLSDLEERGASAITVLDTVGRRDERGEAAAACAGLDINPFAVNIAQMNLLFLLLDLYQEAREEAQRHGEAEPPFPPLSVYKCDSLISEIVAGNQGGEQHTMPLVYAPQREREAVLRRDSMQSYDFVVMNPPYVRWERLPEYARQIYQRLYKDVFTGNRDIYVAFLKKGLDWLREGCRLGVIVSYGVADADAASKLRAFLGSYSVERLVPLEWAPDVFISNVNTFMLILRKGEPPPGHQVTLVHGIQTVKDLAAGGRQTPLDQRRWLALPPDGTWRLEVTAADLPILEKMKQEPCVFSAGYGMERRVAAVERRTLISNDPRALRFPHPLLDGREIKAWSIEWQGRWIDYEPTLYEAPKTLEFFAPPKLVARLISLTTQVAVDDRGADGKDKRFVALNTAVVLRARDKTHTLNDRPYLAAALLNSLPIRYYSFLMLRAGVMEGSHRSHFYPSVFENLPVPSQSWKDPALAQELEGLGLEAHRIARLMFEGDRQVVAEIDGMLASKAIPFIQYERASLKGVKTTIDLTEARLEELAAGQGEALVAGKNVVTGDPRALAYILARCVLEGWETLSKADLERFLIPANKEALQQALERLAQWQAQKPGLGELLRGVESQIDELALESFRSLTRKERAILRRRTSAPPMSAVLEPDLPGAPTKQIPVKYYRAGERYQL